MKTILDEQIREELQGLYKRLGEEGKLPTTAQLSNYCETFRSRFGPDKLKNLDGEALLETMHGPGNKDSLVYWLEFKDDEEFPSPRFGSIAGGSAFKFGLFRKSETGRWTTGSSKGPIELTVEQAIDKARKHRDQLLRGIELLEQMPVDGTDEDYARLQLEMNHVAPDVSDLAWAHKYFHLLFTEKLDDFHNPNYQRFHLIRLLQLPPQGEGRYFAAGRFVALAQTLDIPMNTLTAILNGRDGATPYNYWRIGTSEKERGEREYWPRMLEGNYCAIRWPEVGDLSAISNDKTGQERIRQIMQARYPHETAQSIGKMVHQIFSFRWKLNQGDVVLATAGESVIGIGKVRGEYKFEQTDNFPHRRGVEWLSFDEWKLPDPEASTVAYRMKKDINLVESERHMLNAAERPPYAPAREAAVHVASVYVTPPLPRLPDIAVHIQAILERKGQVILYGPPGTGKTYWAEYTARELAARSRFSIPFDQLHAEQQTFLFGDSDYVQGNVRMCSFHPAYGYEDFLEGFRPEPVNGQMQFVLRDGIFKKLCKDAEANPNQQFYLIIDEINRGDIPRIFGELLTVIEKDKRGKTVLLPLTGTPFRVPANVYLIGTMNTADRSIALLDTALRRRFGFIELMPDPGLLGDAVIDSIPLGPWLKALNERICTHVGRDARNLQIGHSYLLEKGRPIGDFAIFAKVLREDILPLLEEYCYEDYTALEKILGSSLVDVQKQQVHHELFQPSNRDLLIQAVLAPSPEITTSLQAVSGEAQAVEEDGEEDDENVTGKQP